MEPASGVTFDDRYRLDQCLGQGGMGVVWSATDTRDDSRVALKFLRPRASDDGDSTPAHYDSRAVRRFVREARAAMAIDHPNVIRIHEIVIDGPIPFIVMELLLGESLQQRLGRTGPMRIGDVARILLPVISAVGSIHAAGIVHRDLKPDNIFISKKRDGGGRDVRVLDFGIARLTATEGAAAQSGMLTSTGAMVGTPYYMAPEQFYNEKDLDHRADVWALGVILYECLSGQKPIMGDSLGQIFKGIAAGSIEPIGTLVQGLPADVAELVGRMLTFDRAQRTHDLREVHAVLSRHSDLSTMTFAGPSRTLDFADRPATPAVFKVTPGAHASADTLGSSMNRTGNPAPPPDARRPILPMIAGAAVLAAVAIFAVQARKSATPEKSSFAGTPSPSPTTPAVASSAAAVPSPQPSSENPTASGVASSPPTGLASSAPAAPLAKIAATPPGPKTSSPSVVTSAASAPPVPSSPAPAPSGTGKTGVFKGW